jgi:small conductance mechanosensitive channel
VTSLNSRQRDGLAMRLLLLLVRSGLKLLPIAAFAAVAYGLLPVFEPQRVTRLVALALVNAHILASLITVVGDFVFAARAPGLRIPRISDETAYYLRIWLRRLVVIGVYGYFTLEAALLLGLEPGAQLVAQKILGAVLTIMAAVFVLQNRGAVAGALRGGKGEALYLLRARLADVWHLLALLYLVAGYLVWALNIPGGFEFIARATVLTFVVLGAVRLIYVAVVRILDRGFRLTSEMRERFPLLEARANRYLPMVRRGAQIVIFGFGALALLQVWGLNIFGWLASDFGRALGGRIVTIVLIVVLALAFWEVVSALIERFLRQRSTDEGKSSARLLTLLPLIRNVVRVALAVLVALIVLSEIGIDIGPLLAGAGVVGLAIGFGAQALVKDVITGVFILLEDAMSVGDWVEVGGVTGGVESMSIRSVRLRDLNGVVHVVPFGDIAKVTNMNREFGYALMDIGVAYRENVDDVIEVLKEIGADIREDETFGPLILEDMEVFGLNNLGDSAVEIRVRLKTKPLRQWGVRREFLRRTKKRFDELGIEIPFPHQTLYFGVDKEGKAPPARVRLEEAAEKAEAEDRKRKARKRSKAPEGREEEAAKTPAEEEPDENPKPGDIT